MSSPFGFLLARNPPSRLSGAASAVALIAACTAIIYPLAHVVTVVSLSVVYLPAVLVVSVTWGAWLGIPTAVLSTVAFNFFHLAPLGRLTIGDSRSWVALAALLVVAALASSLAEVTRARTRESEERREEADLAAEMARLLLRGNSLDEALPTAGARLAHTLGLHSARIVLGAEPREPRMLAFALREGAGRLGTLLVGHDTQPASVRRLRERVVPALEALLSAARERDRLLAGVVETAALRRADTVKTAVLRSVSHDLRSPLTAISAAAGALACGSLEPGELAEMGSVIEEETTRLARLVDNLLDLSRLEAGAAEPRASWSSLEDVIVAALAQLGVPAGRVLVSIDPELPLLRIDPVQMERAFANVLDNGLRHGGGHPVSVRARLVHTLPARPAAASGQLTLMTLDGHTRAQLSGRERVIVRIVDRGSGIDPLELERVFEPFYRAPGAPDGHRGSGLGLAIARGFTEANGGTLHVESLPGQGSTFVFELPLERAADHTVSGGPAPLERPVVEQASLEPLTHEQAQVALERAESSSGALVGR